MQPDVICVNRHALPCRRMIRASAVGSQVVRDESQAWPDDPARGPEGNDDLEHRARTATRPDYRVVAIAPTPSEFGRHEKGPGRMCAPALLEWRWGESNSRPHIDPSIPLRACPTVPVSSGHRPVDSPFRTKSRMISPLAPRHHERPAQLSRRLADPPWAGRSGDGHIRVYLTQPVRSCRSQLLKCSRCFTRSLEPRHAASTSQYTSKPWHPRIVNQHR